MTEGTKGARVARSLKRVNDKHGKALKRLGESRTPLVDDDTPGGVDKLRLFN
jgi:hypothetical protein